MLLRSSVTGSFFLFFGSLFLVCHLANNSFAANLPDGSVVDITGALAGDDCKNLQHDTLTIPGLPGKSLQDYTIKIANSLTDDERKTIVHQLEFYMTWANTAFSDSCSKISAELKEELKDDAEMRNMFIEIAIGFLVPGMGRVISKFVAALPKNAPVQRFTATFEKLEKSKLVEKIAEGATKIATKKLQSAAAPLLMQMDQLDFVENLKAAFTSEMKNLLFKKLKCLSDIELVTLWAIYDPDVTNGRTYSSAIREMSEKYRNEIKPIGVNKKVPAFGGPGERTWTLVWLQDLPWQRLALITLEEVWAPGPKNPGKPDCTIGFVQYVSNEMEGLAIEKYKQLHNRHDPPNLVHLFRECYVREILGSPRTTYH